MRPFQYVRATDLTDAARACTPPTSKYLAGGTNLLDLMKEDVERPTALVDVTRLDLAAINKPGETAELSIGALTKNSDVANHPQIRVEYPLLSQAILAGASGQIRNMATAGGNLNQRTRCSYFYDPALPCNKREPGSGCSAFEGVNRGHAIFGWSPECVATHPSDMCVALAALDAVVRVRGSDGQERNIPFADYHRLPHNRPELDNTLEHGDLITSIELPANGLAEHSCYLKVRERTSYAFALVSVAAALEIEGNLITDVRLAMGGVAHKPWRADEAEQRLVGQVASRANFEAAAAAQMNLARPLQHNAFKVVLGQRLLVRALETSLSGTGG